MLEIIVALVVLRFVPTRLAIKIAKILSLDIRRCWSFERLDFLQDRRSEIYIKSRLRLYYLVTPVGYGIAWGCAMESSFRVINIARLLVRPEYESSKLLLKLLAKEVRFIESNLETHSYNNHYLFNVVALYVGFLFCGDRVNADKWLAESASTFTVQFNPDGSNFEGSTSYHYLVLELIAMMAELCPESIEKIHSSFNWRGAIEFARCCRYGPCEIWNIGDNDSSAINKAGDRRNREAQLAYIIETMGYKPIERFGEFAFLDFGVVFYRYNTVEWAIWNPSVGQLGKGGHNHNDCLSITLAVDGEAILVDPGVYSYARKRNIYRSSACHSGPGIPGGEHEELLSAFQITNTGTRHLRTLGTTTLASFEGEELAMSRRIEIKDTEVVVTDTNLQTDQLIIKFVLHPNVSVFFGDKELILRRQPTKRALNISFLNDYVGIFKSPYQYSPCYGVEQKAEIVAIDVSERSFNWSFSII